MSNKNRVFEMFVIIFVTLTGAGFGVLTGLVYSQDYWWVGIIAGAFSSYPLSKWYLNKLMKISLKGYNKKMIWVSGTFFAMICGVICTTLVHTIMAAMSLQMINSETDGFLLLTIAIAELIGAGAGLIVGGICSLIYVLSIQGKSNATS